MEKLVTSKAVGISKGVNTLAKKDGKYVCIALGMFILYDLCSKAMERNYALSVHLCQDGSVNFSFNPPDETVEQ